MNELSILQNAVNAYNIWRRNHLFTTEQGGRRYKVGNDFRGIFYNKLRKEWTENAPCPRYDFSIGDHLPTSKIICYFDSNGYLVDLDFETIRTYGMPGYVSFKESMISKLKAFASNLTFSTYPEREYYEIESFITNVQNFKVI